MEKQRKTSKTNRDIALDFTRGIAMIIVVIGHAAQIMGNAGIIISNFIQSFQMALFMFISGYTLYISFPIISGKNFLANKIRTILIPYISWISIILIINTIIYKQQPSLHEIYSSILTSQFWFLRILLYIYIVYTIINYLTHSIKSLPNIYSQYTLLILFYMIIIISLFFISNLPGCYNLWKHFLFFTLGFLFHKYEIFITQIKQKYILISCTFLIFILSYMISSYDIKYISLLADMIAALSGCISHFMLYKYTPIYKHLPLVRKIGNNTLGIYSFHWIILFYFGYGKIFIPVCNLFTNNIAVILLGLIWTLVSYLVIIILSQFTITKNLLL